MTWILLIIVCLVALLYRFKKWDESSSDNQELNMVSTEVTNNQFDNQEAENLDLETAASNGDIDACVQLALTIDNTLIDNRAFSLMHDAAISGHPEAQYRLYRYYEKKNNTYGTQRWLERAANNGHVYAQYDLSMNYTVGICGYEQNKEKAKYWVLKAIQQNNKEANEYYHQVMNEFKKQIKKSNSNSNTEEEK